MTKTGSIFSQIFILWVILLLVLPVGCGPNDSALVTPASSTKAPVTRTTEPTLTPEPTFTPQPPTRILFIGNSVLYKNDGVEYHMAQLAASANSSLTIEAESSTRGGASLEGLWKFTKSLERIESGDYDVVVVQGDIQLSSSFKESKSLDSFYEYARKFDEVIKASGARTVLYMAWPVEEGGKMPITYEEIDQAHRIIAEELGTDVAPVALAMQRSMEERPDLDVIEYDQEHPSIYGTYLAANVAYATIYSKSPEGLTYRPPERFYNMLSNGETTDGISEEAAAFLQKVAWQTVQDYQAN